MSCDWSYLFASSSFVLQSDGKITKVAIVTDPQLTNAFSILLCVFVVESLSSDCVVVAAHGQDIVSFVIKDASFGGCTVLHLMSTCVDPSFSLSCLSNQKPFCF